MRFFRPLAFIILPAAILAGYIWMNAADSHAAQNADTGPRGAIRVDNHNIGVVDGDTIRINGVTYDLAGIDAPELGQQCRHNGSFWDCGMASAMQLRKYFAMSPFAVNCWPGHTPENTQTGATAPGNPAAHTVGTLECSTGERDIAAAMIIDGEVMPQPGYSHHYDELADQARNAEIGIHGGDMVPPAQWRGGKRLDGESARCLYGHDDTGHYMSALDPRYGELAPAGKNSLCSDEEARNKGLSYRP